MNFCIYYFVSYTFLCVQNGGISQTYFDSSPVGRVLSVSVNKVATDYFISLNLPDLIIISSNFTGQ